MLEAGVLHNKMMQIFQDIGLANNIAHMLVEAVSFADPELEAIEENELILEFHSKCITLHRGIQIYLTEVTEAPIPNEKCLTSLLACNEELVMAFTAYDNMIERCRSTRTVRANQSIDVTAAQQASGLQHIHNKTSDMLIQRPIAIDEGSGVGSGYTLMDSINSKSKGVSQSPKLESYAGPFANDLYRISEPGDVSTAIRNGKRPDTHQEALSSSEKDAFSEQERELIQLIKDQSLQDIGRIGSSSSSAAAPSTTPVSPVK
ncbi:hypothetical protein BGZ54_010459 [Gamsiella multidivaricata]|nr:hypothetical protein BGZ54_010459 [Gamsiella multidivaricata]